MTRSTSGGRVDPPDTVDDVARILASIESVHRRGSIDAHVAETLSRHVAARFSARHPD